ncbi:ATPase [Paenibacillus sp. Soil766]|uniref:SRPBCC family protein n=1 Tax=Paenibacillus sp. Soil766 TaxID=1736404 RepID=UPI000709D4F5|nr:SRPBCC domain-containing protein [Paenibacillus sp. Soil766]KRF03783.1 ATPase [Paenibacillus sp. Soil766]
MKKTLVGQTASAGFQVGVRRTLPISPEQAWTFLTSSEGLQLWLGNVSFHTLEEGGTFISDKGITVQFRVVKPLSHIRLKWKKEGWTKPSTLQIRLISNKPDRTTFSFHQENLDHLDTREQMKLYWEDVLTAMKEKLD